MLTVSGSHALKSPRGNPRSERREEDGKCARRPACSQAGGWEEDDQGIDTDPPLGAEGRLGQSGKRT